ncbi:MAG: response regulator transcription factor [Lachnospiraceae bacterium]|nr:response regulator transcription factor [Lachnospiraceae bacterium]
MATILLVDDDTEVLKINQSYLTQEGFVVHIADHPTSALSLVKKLQPDCIVLDVMMPEMDGFTLCHKLRTFTQAPVIFLTGCSGENEKITGLTSGAEDYMIKPYSLRELKVRIDLLLRRFAPAAPAAPAPSSVLTFRNLTIDQLAHKAFFKGEDLMLAKREYEVLLYLATHPNQEITFAELGTALFGTYQESDRRLVMVNVSRLRKKFEGIFELENMIETVWSKGYRFLT